MIWYKEVCMCAHKYINLKYQRKAIQTAYFQSSRTQDTYLALYSFFVVLMWSFINSCLNAPAKGCL